MDSEFKNILISVCVFMFLFIISIWAFIGFGTPTLNDVELQANDSNLYAGKSEFCRNNVINLKCAEGLECVIVDDNGPYEIGVCLTKGVTKDDPEYKETYDMYLNNKIEIHKESFN